MGEGLKRVLRACGSMKCGDILWLWDYANEEAVLAKDMPPGSRRWAASERARFLKSECR